MIYELFEQKYTNLNRKYFHGQPLHYVEPHQTEYYLTTQFAYAFNFAIGNFGEVIEYNLKKEADIFNAASKKDAATLRSFCKKEIPQYCQYVELLKKNDWSKLRENSIKESLISIVQQLGYDGYFNWEIDDKVLDKYHRDNIFKFDFFKESPSIGIFNKNILVTKNVWNKNNYKDCKNYKDFVELELKIIKDKALEDKRNYIDSKDTINFLRRRILAVPYEQIKQIVEETTLEEAVVDKIKTLTENKDLWDRLPYIYKVWPDIPTTW